MEFFYNAVSALLFITGIYLLIKSWRINAKNKEGKYMSRSLMSSSYPEYEAYLRSLPEKTRKAWLEGSWDVFEGQFIEQETRRRLMSNPPFEGGNWLVEPFLPDPNVEVRESQGSKNESKPTGFKPGMTIADYVKKELKNKNLNATRAKWLKTFQRCVLSDDVKQTIEDALITILSKSKFEEWGINETFEKGLANSMMIYGPPGTGKTMVSESIAAVLGKNLLKATTAEIQSSKPGQAERNVTKLFQQAREENAVLLFDECDSLLYNRDAVGMIMASEINHLLTEIENFDGVVILTTNRLGRLDPALQRRIIAKIELGLPNEKIRQEIWSNLLPSKMPLAKNVSIPMLAKMELAGGEIKNAILLAARRAIASCKDEVDMEHFNYALEFVLKGKADFEKASPKRVQEDPQDKARDTERDMARAA